MKTIIILIASVKGAGAGGMPCMRSQITGE